MTRKFVAVLGALAFASLSTAAHAGCVGHTAQTSTPVQTAQISTPADSGQTETAQD